MARETMSSTNKMQLKDVLDYHAELTSFIKITSENIKRLENNGHKKIRIIRTHHPYKRYGN